MLSEWLAVFLPVAAVAAGPAAGQVVEAGPRTVAEQPRETDIKDLVRRILHRERQASAPPAAGGGRQPALTVVPTVSSKPSTGVSLGAAGVVDWYGGDTATTRVSSAILALSYSTKQQASIIARLRSFSAAERWHLQGDNRLQWTSQDTYGLGTDSPESDGVNAKFDFFRVYESVYRQLRPGLYGGLGFHYNNHSDVRPGTSDTAAWDQSEYIRYSDQHGFDAASQTSAGAALNLLVETRDSPVNASRGWYANASFRHYFDGFLGGDSSWQELSFDLRTYRGIAGGGRHKLAFWLWADLITGGVAPYFDLPATGMDSFGRSSRGYQEGRFRGERLVYGEIEYRATLTRNGLLGLVAFVNTSSFSNLESGERLFDAFATGAGFGFRFLFDKRSKTNLCVDYGRGKDGSSRLYLAIQEAF